MTANDTGTRTTISTQDGKYSIAVEDEIVGHALFTDRHNQRVFYHTEINPAYGGRGLATRLVEKALTDARDDGMRVVPVCSMIVTVLNKHPEFDDITDPVTPELLRWVQS